MIETYRLTNLIAPSFYGLHCDVKRHGHTHYWLAGGRGSTKSSFIGSEIPLGMMQHPERNAICFRKYGTYLLDSVYSQIVWTIYQMGVEHLWRQQKSPLRLIYEPTGQQIIFRGLDDPRKSKSVKVSHGYIAYVWYEECDEFTSMEEIEMINQSVLRGGDAFWVFYSFNPPKSKNAWVNAEITLPRPDKRVHKSSYEKVPAEWLGEQFITEALYVKQHNFDKYRHVYLGEATGTGGEVFRNVTLREIPREEILGFDNLRRGLDWGYGGDPFTYLVGNYDKKHHRLWLFYEKYGLNISNKKAAEFIQTENILNQLVYCDNSEPKSISYLQDELINALPCDKYNGSREEGYAFMSDDIDEIIIDPVRCPNAAREFVGYELEQDAYGNFKSKYPDKNDHCLVGETLVETTDGPKPIKDLVGKTGDVYCYDRRNKCQTVARFNDCRMTRETAEIYELELTDGRKVQATGDHLVMTQRGWVEIQGLCQEDWLLDIWRDSDGR
jgi:phage terminase large subunit